MGEHKKSTHDMLNRLQEANQEIKVKENKKVNILSFLIGLGATLLILGVGLVVLFSMPQENQKVDKVVKVKETEVKKETPTTRKTIIDLPTWAKKAYDTLTKDDYEKMIADQEDNFIGWAANSLPSEKDGFTSDKSKAYDKDGLPNEYYTNKTKEKFTKDMAIIVNRVINPIFGNWEDFQEPTGLSRTDILTKIYKDLGSPEYISSIIENKSPSVIFFDEQANLYDGAFKLSEKDAQQANKFIGVIKKGDISFNDDGSEIKIAIEVDYLSSKNTVFKSKSISLTVQNKDDSHYEIVGGEVREKEDA